MVDLVVKVSNSETGENCSQRWAHQGPLPPLTLSYDDPQLRGYIVEVAKRFKGSPEDIDVKIKMYWSPDLLEQELLQTHAV
jgi:hypothetical protein